MANKQNSVINQNRELRTAITETQNRIKAKMFGHGMIKAVADKTGISKYKIRQAITGTNPSIEILEAIERALTKSLKAA